MRYKQAHLFLPVRASLLLWISFTTIVSVCVGTMSFDNEVSPWGPRAETVRSLHLGPTPWELHKKVQILKGKKEGLS